MDHTIMHLPNFTMNMSSHNKQKTNPSFPASTSLPHTKPKPKSKPIV